jgi:hypothetical protein
MNNKILNLIGRRLLVGERKYGHENVTNDGRNFVEEALEESLDLAVYVAARLIEIKQKEIQMGRAIDQDNRLDDHERRLKLVEDALEEMIQTRVHHVDLTDTNDVRTEGVEVEPDEKFTAPPVKHKRTTTRKRAEATT